MGWIQMLSSRTQAACVLGTLTLLTGCPEDDSARATKDAAAGTQGDASQADADSGKPAADSCMPTVRRLAVAPNDSLNLLFVVDNSESMAGEQAALRAALPGFIRTLTKGERYQDDPSPFPPINDIHIGVVSTDMGIPGVVQVPNCDADGGDDGRLLQASSGAACEQAYPRFLSYRGDGSDATELADDVSCLASVGTNGCGVEQPLEAALKALTTRDSLDEAGDPISQSPFRFVATSEQATFGRGDRENLGFLRMGGAQGDSVLAIIVITDHEDCSVKATGHLSPENQVPDDLNVRCVLGQDALYDVQARFYAGLRALRPGREDRVVFLGIAGVPSDLVDQQALAELDYDDASSRESFYTTVLDDPRMQVAIEGGASGKQTPSCTREVPGQDNPSTAYPPRRIVELAKLFGKNGAVQSICQDDLRPALDAIHGLVQAQLGPQCLSRKLARGADDKVACDLVWQLPAGSTRCDELPFLSPADSESSTAFAANGGAVCKLAQRSGDGDGWFYDDSTDSCPRIAFTDAAKPPAGVVVKLACSSPFGVINRSDRPVHEPSVGSPCHVGGDAECTVVRSSGTRDKSLFCQPELQVCVKSCTSDASCKQGWTCQRDDGDRAFCVVPKCGE